MRRIEEIRQKNPTMYNAWGLARSTTEVTWATSNECINTQHTVQVNKLGYGEARRQWPQKSTTVKAYDAAANPPPHAMARVRHRIIPIHETISPGSDRTRNKKIRRKNRSSDTAHVAKGTHNRPMKNGRKHGKHRHTWTAEYRRKSTRRDDALKRLPSARETEDPRHHSHPSIMRARIRLAAEETITAGRYSIT